MWSLEDRINNLLLKSGGNSKCRFFYIDRDGDWRFRGRWFSGKKLNEFEDEEIQYFIEGLEEEYDKLSFATKLNIKSIKKEFKV